MTKRLLAHTYNRLPKTHQDRMKYYFALIEWLKSNQSELGYQLSKPYGAKPIKSPENTAPVVETLKAIHHR